MLLFIPSYNRPCQLYALLESINKYDKYDFLEPQVFYQGTISKYQEAYSIVIDKFKDWVDFVPKSRYHYIDVSKSLDTTREYWGVSTDDSIIYREFKLTTEELNKVFDSSTNHFSLRLGYNTTTIDYSNPKEQHYLDGRKVDNLIRFYWPNHTNHYRHPFALDSFITKTEYMKQTFIRACSPSGFDYRSMECKIGDYFASYQNKPFALCFPESVLVNVPANKVCDGPYLKNGVVHPYTTEELNQKFLDGQKIDLTAIAENNIDNVQMELQFKFIER